MATESFQSQKRSLPLWWRPPAGQKTEKQTNLSLLQSTINLNQFSPKAKKKTDLQYTSAEQKSSCIRKASFQRQLWKAAKNIMVLPTCQCQKKRVEPAAERQIPAWRKKLLRSFLHFCVLRLETANFVVFIVARISVIQIFLCLAMASLLFGDDAGVEVHN